MDEQAELHQQYRALHYMQSHGKNSDLSARPCVCVCVCVLKLTDVTVITRPIAKVGHSTPPSLEGPLCEGQHIICVSYRC